MKKTLLSVCVIFTLVLLCMAVPAMAAENIAQNAGTVEMHEHGDTPEMLAGNPCGGCFGYDTYDYIRYYYYYPPTDYKEWVRISLFTLCGDCTYQTWHYDYYHGRVEDLP